MARHKNRAHGAVPPDSVLSLRERKKRGRRGGSGLPGSVGGAGGGGGGGDSQLSAGFSEAICVRRRRGLSGATSARYTTSEFALFAQRTVTHFAC